MNLECHHCGKDQDVDINNYKLDEEYCIACKYCGEKFCFEVEQELNFTTYGS